MLTAVPLRPTSKVQVKALKKISKIVRTFGVPFFLNNMSGLPPEPYRIFLTYAELDAWAVLVFCPVASDMRGSIPIAHSTGGWELRD